MEDIAAQFNQFVFITIFLAGIPLAVATVVGLVISFLQAITQIQDPTLGQTAKIAAIVFVLLSTGAGLLSPLLSSTSNLFSTLHILSSY